MRHVVGFLNWKILRKQSLLNRWKSYGLSSAAWLTAVVMLLPLVFVSTDGLAQQSPRPMQTMPGNYPPMQPGYGPPPGYVYPNNTVQQRPYYPSPSAQAGYGGQDQALQNIIIILDASDSMNQSMGGTPKIQLAKDAVLQTLSNLPPNIRVGLRVYGHRFVGHQNIFSALKNDAANCQQTELMVPLGFNNRGQIAQRVQSIQAVGKTPISYAIQRSLAQDFAGSTGNNHIILVSDGRETCSQNPCDLALSLVRSGVNVKINTIGFGLTDYVAQDQLKCVAATTKGKFYDAQTAAQLVGGLQETVTNVNARIITRP